MQLYKHPNAAYLTWVTEELAALPYRKAPGFLGQFSYLQYKRGGLLNYLIKNECNVLRRFVLDQDFNTVFLQRYLPGQNVLPHRDPRNNIGHTVIGLYGNFSGTYLKVEGHTPVYQQPGDIVVLPCTINGVQGPQHSMEWEQNGTGVRYAIILNTIVK